MHVCRWPALDRGLFPWRQFGLKLIGNRFRDFALDGKDISQLAVVSFRPKMGVAPRVDQLCVDTDASAGALYTSFDYVRHPELLRDLAQVALNSRLVLHHTRTTDDFEISD